MAAENVTINILMHDLVPEHVLLTKEEAEQMLAEKHITCDQLPKIRLSDAAIKVMDVIRKNENKAPIAEGDIVKVIRSSSTAEQFVAYRLVTRG